MFIFIFLCNKKISFNAMLVLSCVISYMCLSFITFLNDLCFHNSYIENAIIISGLSTILSSLLSLVFCKFYCSTIFKKLLVKHYYRTPNDDIWSDILDFKNGSNLKVFLRSKDYYIIGHYKFHEENGKDSWMALSAFGKVDKETNNLLSPNYLDRKDIMITFPLADVEHVEVF